MEYRPFLITAREKKDRSILTTVIACFLVALVVGVGLSYFSSRHADQMAASSGSSTRSDGPNTPAGSVREAAPRHNHRL